MQQFQIPCFRQREVCPVYVLFPGGPVDEERAREEEPLEVPPYPVLLEPHPVELDPDDEGHVAGAVATVQVAPALETL